MNNVIETVYANLYLSNEGISVTEKAIIASLTSLILLTILLFLILS